MKLLLISILLAGITSACSTQPQNIEADWPSELPPKDFFVEQYTQNTQLTANKSEYLMWVKRFYMGWELYSPGWLQASNELISTLESETDKKTAQYKTAMIGQLVAAEWAKENRYRIIDSRHLNIWGNALNQSITQNEQLMMLGKILNDVQTLLDKELAPQQIASSRYYNSDSFGGEFE